MDWDIKNLRHENISFMKKLEMIDTSPKKIREDKIKLMIQQFTVKKYLKEVNIRYRTSRLPKPKKVAAFGTWDNWSNPINLKFDKENNVWKTKKIMKSGRYQYKFLVDNEWKYREALPYIENADYVVNNILVV